MQVFTKIEKQLDLQYSPKIMHAQEVAQEFLAPQEHASGEKKLNCALSARSSTRKKIKILSARSRKKLRVLPQTANNRQIVFCVWDWKTCMLHIFAES